MSKIRKVTLLLLAFLLLNVVNILAQGLISDRYQYLSPKPGSLNHNPETEITIRFGESLDKTTIRNEFVQVVGEVSGKHKGLIALCDDQLTIRFIPESVFFLGEKVKIRLAEGVKTETGKSLPEVEYWFTIRKTLGGDSQPDQSINKYDDQNNLKSNTGTPEKSGSLYFNDLFFCKILKSNNPASGNIITTLEGVPGHYLYVFNSNGVPVFLKKFPAQVYNLKPQPNGVLTYYDFKTRSYIAFDSTLNIIDTINMKNGYKPHTHELLIQNNGHIFLFAYDPQIVDMSKIVDGGKPYATVTGLVIQELDEEKNLIFQWRSWDHISITDSYVDLLVSSIDYVHGNSLDADTDTTLILSSRNLSEVTKINRLSGNIIWRLGGKRNGFVFVNDSRGFSMQHSASKLKNGNLLLFDNGVGLNPEYSRGLEYTLDEINRSVELVEEFRHTPDISSHNKGNIQRIDDSNTLIFWGQTPLITEFDGSGKISFDATFESGLFPTYRAYRSDWKPGLFTFDSDVLDFSQVYQGNTETRSFNITNKSNESISITSVHNRNTDFFISESFPVVISPGQTRSLNVNFSSSEAGLSLDTLNVCYESDSIMVNRQLYVRAESIPITDIEEVSNVTPRIYPNPGKGNYTIRFPDKLSYNIRVTDVSGITILKEKILNNNSFSFNLSDSSPDGLYIIQIEIIEDGTPLIFKIIKSSKYSPK